MPNLSFKNLFTRKQRRVRATFTNRGLAKVVKSARSLQDSSPDKQSVLNVVDTLADVKVEKKTPVSFKSIPELIGIDYVGYIVDKERLDPVSGQWIRTDEYKILGTEANTFKDSRVAYGHQYRYRIKSLIKVTTKVVKSNHSNLESFEDVKRFERKTLKRQLKSKSDLLANIGRITNIGLRNKSSQGKKSITHFDLMRGFKMRADERKTEPVRVSIRDPKGKIRNLRRSKKLAVSDIDFLKGSISRESLQKEMIKNIRRSKEETVEYVSHYYESDPSKDWVYVNVTEDIPPPPPSSIKIVPSSPRAEITVTWLKPPNSQRDIKFFKLYRRNRVGQRWTMLKQFPEEENVYVDKFSPADVRVGRKVIYALTCVDAHGIESFLSIQTQAEFNPNYELEREERNLKWISGSGVEPEESNVVLKKFLDQELPTVAKRSIYIQPTRNFSDTEKNLILRITSLDTHEQKEFKVNLRNLNIREQE
jgi:fibronectin type 3 domain-containing protein